MFALAQTPTTHVKTIRRFGRKILKDRRSHIDDISKSLNKIVDDEKTWCRDFVNQHKTFIEKHLNIVDNEDYNQN